MRTPFHPFTDFTTCQVCGKTSDDICDFQMWELVDAGILYHDKFLILCNKRACFKLMDAAEDLFRRVPHSRGGPGAFMLLCGDCPYRGGFDCGHPHLKENGGDGLLINFQPLFGPGTRICFHSGHSIIGTDPEVCPAVACEGHPTRKPTVNDRVEVTEKP